MRSEAARRADKKYRSKMKQWNIKLKPETYELVEKARGTTTRAKWLEDHAREILKDEDQ